MGVTKKQADKQRNKIKMPHRYNGQREREEEPWLRYSTGAGGSIQAQDTWEEEPRMWVPIEIKRNPTGDNTNDYSTGAGGSIQAQDTSQHTNSAGRQRNVPIEVNIIQTMQANRESGAKHEDDIFPRKRRSDLKPAF